MFEKYLVYDHWIKLLLKTATKQNKQTKNAKQDMFNTYWLFELILPEVRDIANTLCQYGFLSSVL